MEPHRAAIEARMHAVAVEFDFMEPGRSFRRLVDELGELRQYPLRQRTWVGAPRALYSLCHADGIKVCGTAERKRSD